MKAKSLVSLTVLIIAAAVAGCGGSGTTGSGPDALLALLPMDAAGVFYMDVHGAMNTPAIRKVVGEKNDEYLEFVEKTGIDPAADVCCLAGIVESDAGKDNKEGVVVIDLTYDPDAMLARMKEHDGDVETLTYEGATLFRTSNEGGDPTWGAFLDDRHIAFGSEPAVRGAVDVKRGKAKGIRDNAVVMKLVDATDRTALCWAAFSIPAERVDEAATQPMMGGLKGLRSVTGMLDYKSDTLVGEIVTRSEEPGQNAAVGEMLTMIKGFMRMGAAEKPELGELMEAIVITSDETHCSLRIAISDDLMAKLSALRDGDDDPGTEAR